MTDKNKTFEAVPEDDLPGSEVPSADLPESKDATAADLERYQTEQIPEALGYTLGGLGLGYGVAEEGLKGSRNAIRWFERAMAGRQPTVGGINPNVQATPPGGGVSPQSKYGQAMHGGTYTMSPDMSDIYAAGREATQFRQANPMWDVKEGTGLAVPKPSFAEQRAELAAQKTPIGIAKKIGTGIVESTPAKIAGVAGRIAAPAYGGYQLGTQGAQAYNRLTNPQGAGDIAAGAANVAGAGLGAYTMVPSRPVRIGKFSVPSRVPAAIGSYLFGKGADAMATKKKEEKEEEFAAGGVIKGYNKGKLVKEGIEAGLDFLKKQNAAGKSGARLAREAAYKHDVRPIHQFGEVPKLSIQELQNKVLVGVPGDRSLTGHEVHSIAGIPLSKPVELHGGPRYGQKQLEEGKQNFWASQSGAASSLQNKVARAVEETGREPFGLYTAMAPDSSNYALHHTESLINQLGALNPDRKSIEAFNKEIRQAHPAFFGLQDPNVMDQLRTSPDLRKLIAERLNKQSYFNQLGLPSGEATIHAITEPALRDVATGTTGFSVGKLDPHAKLSIDVEGIHPTYNTQIPGEFKGEMIAQLPWEFYFPDVAKQIAANPKQAPHAFGTFKMGQFHQPVTQEMVDIIAPIEEAILKGKKEGGEVKGYSVGSKVAKSALGFFKPAAKSHNQDPKVAKALEDYLKGNISQQERIAIVNQQLPLRPWTQLPPDYSDEQIKMALMENKRPKALLDVPAGMRVGNRLDIPAYTQHGVYVDTTHNLAGSNSPISYNRTGHLKDVEFSSKPNQAVRVGLGTKEQALTPMGAEMGAAKSPFAMIKGTNVGTSDEEVRRMMAEYLKDPEWAQIGMDPRRHSQFYDKATGMPVWSAEEKLQSGPLVLVPKRGLETTSWDDPRLNLSDFPDKKYAEGGLTCLKEGGKTPAWQRKEGKNPNGGLNAKGRASYNRETGGNLKRPQPEGGKRRDSFCARMKGMKKKLTSAETANDPDSRINKSLRAWNC